MDPEMESRLKTIVEPILENARNGDLDHTFRAVEYGKRLLEREAADENIVIPALYLHDIGWSRVDFSDFTDSAAARKKDSKSFLLHMQKGAEMAGEILEKLDFDSETAGAIATIIAIHDEPKKVHAMKDLSATLVCEADRLDRYGPESLKRYRTMFEGDYFHEKTGQVAEYLRRGLKYWFRTGTARALAKKLAGEMGLFNE